MGGGSPTTTSHRAGSGRKVRANDPDRCVDRHLADIDGRQDIEVLVSRFYSRAFADPLIGPVFTDVARLDLQVHMPAVSDFWESALLHSGHYRRNAFVVHRQLHDRHPLLVAHFERWLEIWTTTVDSLYAGPVAERAKTQGARIANSMARRLNAPRRIH